MRRAETSVNSTVLRCHTHISVLARDHINTQTHCQGHTQIPHSHHQHQVSQNPVTVQAYLSELKCILTSHLGKPTSLTPPIFSVLIFRCNTTMFAFYNINPRISAFSASPVEYILSSKRTPSVITKEKL